MATLTVDLPSWLSSWAEDRARWGGFSDAADFVADLVRREEQVHVMTEEELSKLLEDAEASGISDRTWEEIVADAKREAGF